MVLAKHLNMHQARSFRAADVAVLVRIVADESFRDKGKPHRKRLKALQTRQKRADRIVAEDRIRKRYKIEIIDSIGK